MTTIMLSNNNLSGEFPEAVLNMTQLWHLDLSNNNFYGTIPNRVGEFYLKQLFLSSNKFTGSIPPSLLNSTSIQNLMLNNNLLSGPIPPITATSLLQLNLGGNLLEGPFPETLCQLKDLTYLNLGRNSLSGELPSCIGNMTSLYLLDISYYQFSGNLPNISANMQQLLAKQNKFNGCFPSVHGNATNLLVLDVSYNNLSCPLSIFLNSYITKHEYGVTLIELMLSNNHFYGNLQDTESIFQFFSLLSILDLSNNNLTGYIPYGMGSLPLNVLYLENNQLKGINGKLPSFLIVEQSSADVFFDYHFQCNSITNQFGGRVVIDPSYYNYANCTCVAGYFGTPPNCYMCPLGAICGAGGSGFECPSNQFKTSDGCYPCPLDAICDGTENVVSKDGYWIYHYNNTYEAYHCPYGFCLEGNKCSEGRKVTSVLCGECEEGLYSWGTTCTKCDGVNWGLLFGILFLVWLFVLFQHWLVQRPGRGDIKIFLFFLQAATLVITYENNVWTVIMATFSFRSVNTFNLCLAPMDYYEQIIAWLFLPLVCLFVLWLTTLGVIIYKKAKKMTLDEDFYTPYIRTAVALVLFSIVSVVQQALSLLTCYEVGELMVVATQPSISCYSSEYKRWKLVMIILLSSIVGLMSMSIFALIWLVKLKRGGRSRQTHLKRIGVLFECYKPEWYLWEYLVTVRRLAFLIAYVWLYNYPEQRQFTLTMLFAGFLAIQAVAQPYLHKLDNFLEVLSLTSLLALSITISSPNIVSTNSPTIGIILSTGVAIFAVDFIVTRGSRFTELIAISSKILQKQQKKKLVINSKSETTPSDDESQPIITGTL
jgi:hypothetical protein